MRFAVTLIFGFALSCCGVVQAQEISGTVYDRSGAAIGGARVLLMNEDYVKQAETKSGDRGEFEFAGVKPGLYFVQAKKPMFQLSQQHVLLEGGKKARVHLLAGVARGDDMFTIESERPSGVDPSPGKALPLRAGGKVEGYKLLSGRPPGFPDAVRKRGAYGVVVLSGTIRVDGTLSDVMTLESPGPELETVSVEAFRKWHYAPMRLNGVPVESTTLVIFDFKYRGTASPPALD